MEVLFTLINYVILFVLIMIFACVHIWVGRKCSVITTFSLYSLLSSLMLLGVNSGIFINLNLFDGFGVMLNSFFTSFSTLFLTIYTYFCNFISSIFNLFMDSAPIFEFLTNAIFCIALQAVLFILCLLLFRKKNKNKIERSRYCD